MQTVRDAQRLIVSLCGLGFCGNLIQNIEMMVKRMVLLVAAVALLASATTVAVLLAQDAGPVVEVYKSPT